MFRKKDSTILESYNYEHAFWKLLDSFNSLGNKVTRDKKRES